MKKRKKIIPMHGPVEIERFHAFGDAGMSRVTDGCVVLDSDRNEFGSGVESLLRSIAVTVAKYPKVFASTHIRQMVHHYCRTCACSEEARLCLKGVLRLFGFEIEYLNPESEGVELKALLHPPGHDDLIEWSSEHSMILDALKNYVVKGSWFEIQSDSDGEVLRVQWTDKGMVVFARSTEWVQVPNANEYDIHIHESCKETESIFPSITCPKAKSDVT
jgi:hypothetical protein